MGLRGEAGNEIGFRVYDREVRKEGQWEGGVFEGC
jgi:hypothetical protein